MSQSQDKPADKSLDDFLDDQVDQADRESFGNRLATDAELSEQVRLQAQIDDALRRSFAPAEAADADHVDINSRQTPEARVRVGLQRRLVWGSGLAAAAVFIGVTLFLSTRSGRDTEPFFEPQPLAKIYQETVRNGFEPYYECREDDRFAAVFASRQNVPLQLLPMPSGSRMLGLSYPGGLSRDTTAMLCEIDDRPVMVFVDRLSADQEGAAKVAESDLNVFRTVRDGLVFYEVSPWAEPKVTEFLVPQSEQGNS